MVDDTGNGHVMHLKWHKESKLSRYSAMMASHCHLTKVISTYPQPLYINNPKHIPVCSFLPNILYNDGLDLFVLKKIFLCVWISPLKKEKNTWKCLHHLAWTIWFMYIPMPLYMIDPKCLTCATKYMMVLCIHAT